MKSRFAAGLAAAITATTLAVPHAFAADAPAVTSGTLSWPIKESFVKYLGMPFVHGSVEATDGATKVDNSFDFTLNAEDSTVAANGNATLDFDGKLHFLGHEGALDIALDDVKVIVEGTQATITADYATKGALPGQAAVDKKGDDAVMATFALDAPIQPAAGGNFAAKDRATTLGKGAEEAFLNYKEGQKIEDGNVDLSLAFAAADKPGGGSNPGGDSSTGSGSSTGGIVATILGILAALGLLGSLVAQPGLLPKLPFPMK